MATVLELGEVFVVRDTKMGKLMSGAVEGPFFPSRSSLGCSVAHTSWYREAKVEAAMRKLGYDMDYDILIDREKQLADLIVMDADDADVSRAQKDVLNVRKALILLERQHQGTEQYEKLIRNWKLDKDERYIVELLERIETKPYIKEK